MNATRLLALVAALGGVLLIVWLALRTGESRSTEALCGQGVSAEQPELTPEPSSSLPLPGVSEPAAEPAAPAPARVAATGAASQRQSAEREEQPASDEPEWTGRVLSDRGVPLEGAEVTIGSQPATGIMRAQTGLRAVVDASVTTGRDGRFSARRKKARDEPWIEVRATGYRLLSVPVAVDPGAGDRNLGVLVLEPGAVLVGQVVDAGGAPVADARVLRDEERGGMVGAITSAIAQTQGRDSLPDAVVTDAEGRFELPCEDPGPFVLVARHEQYPEARVEGEARPGETCALIMRFAAAASISGRLTGFPAGKQGVKLKARLVEPLEGAAKPGAELTELFASAGLGVAERAIDVREDGSFALYGLHPDRRYELMASMSRGMMQRERCSERKEFQAGEQDVELAYDAGARLVLRLVASGSGEVLRDVDLRHEWIGDPRPRIGLGAAGAGAKPQIAADGTLTVEELRPPTEPGRLRVIVRVPGFLEHEVADIPVPIGEEVDLGTIALRSAGRVRVQVVDAGTGDPVARAHIRLADARPDFLTAAMQARGGGDDGEESFDLEDFDMLRPPRSAKGVTDASGICELPGFFAEEAVLVVNAWKYAPFRRTGLVLRAGGLHEELVQLHSGGTVAVRVVDAFDQPAVGERVQHRRTGEEGNGGTDTRKTRAGGVAEFKRLPAGEHRFRLAPSGGDAFSEALGMTGESESAEEEWSRVSVADGTEQVVVLAVPMKGRLEGYVTSNGRPLREANVSLHSTAVDDTAAAIREFQAELLGGTSSEHAASTDELGRFEIEGFEPGAYELRVSHPERLLIERTELELQAGYNEFDLELPATRLEGRVADGAGRAVAGARVTVGRASGEDADLRRVRALLTDAGAGGAPGEDSTDALGRFVLEGLPAGVSLVVDATHDEFTPGRSEPFELTEGESKEELEIVLEAAGRLLVLAPDVEGPFAFVTASFEPGDGGEGSEAEARTTMLRAGRSLMTGMQPGTWRVRLQTAGNAGSEGELVQIRPGEESKVTLRL